MLDSWIYQFFNNAAVAAILVAVVTFGLAYRYALRPYKEQKRIDKLESLKIEINQDLISIRLKIEYAIRILNRIPTSYQNFKQRKEAETPEKGSGFHNILKEYELPRLSKTINEDIPELEAKINALLEYYFSENHKLVELANIFKKELTEWQIFLLHSFPSKQLNLLEDNSAILEKESADILNSIKNLVDEIDKIDKIDRTKNS